MNNFSAMSANLRFGRADDGPNGWEFRKKAMLEIFYTYTPDFLAVQEANDFQADYLIHHLKEYDFVGLKENAPDFWQNNIIFFRKPWQLDEWRHFFFSDTPHEPSKWKDSKWPRQCTMAKFSKNGKTLAVVDTHFDFLQRVQVRSAKMILHQLKDFALYTPTILMGDFNAAPDGKAGKVFEAQGGFSDVFDGRFGATHHGFTGRPVSGRIDWILYRGPFRPRPSTPKIVRERPGGVFPSDHFQVYTEFRWIQEQEDRQFK